MNDPTPDDPSWLRPRFLMAVVLTGLFAGLGGMLLGMLLHAVQHLAYGYGGGHIISHESFLEGVQAASGPRRVLALVLCGLAAGGGWWLIYRYGRPLVSVKKAVSDPTQAMPPETTMAHAILQIITVGLGSPLGREVAPREVGALAGGRLAALLRLAPAQHRIVIACGAGAGLAAVYNVPLGAALFVLEVLLGSFAWPAVVAALIACCIGAVVAWAGLGNDIQYAVPAMQITASLVVWAIAAGPLFGCAAHGWQRLTAAARAQAASVFIATAAVADWRPAAPSAQKIKKDGSGQAPQLAFTENPDILAAVAQSAAAQAGRLFCVGFAAESQDLAENAEAKRLRKKVPLLVGNIGPDTFGQDHNALLLVDAKGSTALPRASKLSLARRLVEEIAARMADAPKGKAAAP